MYKYQHKKGGGTGGIVVLCPGLRKRWVEYERRKRREKEKSIKHRVESTTIRHKSHNVRRSTKK